MNHLTGAPVSARLEQLLANATPGPWVVQKEAPWIAGHISYDDATLIALAPDMARLLIDMGDALRAVVEGSMWECPFCGRNMENDGHKDDCEYAALLARLDTLGKDTA